MKISYIALLSISLTYGLERPINEKESSNSSPQSIDLSQVKPIPHHDMMEGDSVKDSIVKPETISDSSLLENKHKDNPTWLGVSGEPISKTLGMHLGIEEGIVLRVVAEKSPASIGGLAEHDIITEVNGIKISNQDILREQILSCSSGEEITVKAISQGVSKNCLITLQQRPIQSIGYGENPSPRFNERSSRSFDQFPPSQRKEQGSETSEPKRGLGKMLKDMGLNKLLKEAAPGKAFNLDFQSTSTIRIQDGEGSVEVQTLNDEKNIVVRDKEGNIQFQGPWNTDEDKASVSPEIKERVENIDFNYKSHNLRFGKREKSEIR